MNFFKKPVPKFLFILSIALSATVTYAQDAGAPKTTASSDSIPAFIMAAISMVLAFVIWGMGNVLVTLGNQLLEKQKNSPKVLPVTLLLLGSLLTISTSVKAQVNIDAIKAVPNYGGMDSTAFWIISGVVIIEVIVIAFMMFLVNRIQRELIPQKQKTFSWSKYWADLNNKIFTKAVPVEKEMDILLDHDYDGIKELDNALPPWWKYGFMVTVVIAVVYMLNFHVFGYGKNPEQEYQEEIVQAQVAKELYESKNADKVDETNLQMPSIAGLNTAKEIYNSVCWTCHGKLGEGGAGPNLTDDYWIHKGSLTDVFLSIKHGYPEKGMQAWEKNYSPKEINDLAGYIKTLNGTNPPNGKAPQGDLEVESGITDSTQVTVTTKDISGGNIKK